MRASSRRGRATLDLAQVLRVLGKAGVNEVLVEAGATLAGALIEQRCVDELLLYVAPMVLGDRARGLLRLPEPGVARGGAALRNL